MEIQNGEEELSDTCCSPTQRLLDVNKTKWKRIPFRPCASLDKIRGFLACLCAQPGS